MAAETISIKDALKSVQTGLSNVTPSSSFLSMLFNSAGVPSGKVSFGNPVVATSYNDGVFTVQHANGATTDYPISYTAGTITTDWVDMGLPSGLKWARRNIDVTQPDGFAASEFQYECSFFSWGNVQGHNPSSTSAFDYNWGGSNEQEPYYDGQVYGSTPGNTLTGNIPPSMDAARVNLGAPWRMPSMEDFTELFANIDYIDADGNVVTAETSIAQTAADKRVTVNGINGLYLRSKVNGNRLFFPASGYGSGRSWVGRGSSGNFWSSTFYSARSARDLGFSSGGVYPQNADRTRAVGTAVLRFARSSNTSARTIPSCASLLHRRAPARHSSSGAHEGNQ